MTSLVQPAIVTAAAAARLRDADEALSRKLDATTVQVAIGGRGNTVARSTFAAAERRVLGLVRAAADMIGGPDPAPLPAGSALFPGPSKYAVLGSVGFELPAYVDMFAEAPGWRAAMLRRGTPDPFMSLVQVPTSTFVNAVGARAIADAAGSRGGGAPRRGVHDGARERPRLPHRRRPRAALGVRPSHVETSGRAPSQPPTTPPTTPPHCAG